MRWYLIGRPLALWSVLALTAWVPRAAPAQGSPVSASRERPRFVVAGDLILAKPKSDLAKYIGNGFGGGLVGLLRVDREGVLHLRGDFGAVQYGRETTRVAWPTNFGTVHGDLTTTNNISWYGFGPQMMFPGGPVRPYVNAGVGLTQFRTTSTLTEQSTQDEIGRVDNASDYTTGWMFGGGLYIPFGSGSPITINLGTRYHFGSEATYIQEGGIQDDPSGTVTLTEARSRTNFVLWQLGVSLAIPSSAGRATTGP